MSPDPPTTEGESAPPPPPIPSLVEEEKGASEPPKPPKPIMQLQLARMYCAWLSSCQPLLAADGWPALPDEAIAGLIYPAALRVEERIAKWLAEKAVDQEKADLAIVGAPGAVVAVHRGYSALAKKKEKARPPAPQHNYAPPVEAAAPAPAPAPEQTPVRPTTQQAPAPPQGLYTLG